MLFLQNAENSISAPEIIYKQQYIVYNTISAYALCHTTPLIHLIVEPGFNLENCSSGL